MDSNIIVAMISLLGTLGGSFDGVDVVHIKLAQKSNIEIAQEKQATDIAACEAAIIDIGELLGGE